MSGFSGNTAPIKWAQRKDSLYVTICLPDVKDHTLDVTPKHLSFKGTSNGKEYAIEFDFTKDIKTEGSVWNVLAQSVQMKILKAEEEEEFWPRLNTDKNLEKTHIKIDWDRYVDEDEADGQDFNTDNLDGGMGMGGMGGMPGMGGPGGGAGGMDMAALMQQMQGMGGGAGGAGGMDMEKMMASMGGMGGMPGGMGDMGGDDEGADSDDDADLPDLEETA